ncbi:MAG TPA: efflux RND transporter periplasmic adaptor subunit [Stellaceae bacterium]|nr:efflux RND transporter periplasmic adaptor subunit [Stellaceae bacterium]
MPPAGNGNGHNGNGHNGNGHAAIGYARRRPRPYRRYIIVAVVLIGIAAFAYFDRGWITGDGIVVGQLTPVNPISQVRLKKLMVKCLDFVSRGQVLAQLENEVTAQAADQQLQQFELQLAEARSGAAVADKEAAAARKYLEAQAAVRDQLEQVLKAQTEMVQKNYTATLVWQQSKADLAKAQSETQAADFVVQSKEAESRRSTVEADLTEKRIAAFQASPELMGRYELKAPKAGYLTQCNAYEGSVVNAESVLYQVFNPADAYGIIFVSPSDAPRLVAGDTVQLKVGGIETPVSARISGFYPELSGMPDSLTRYFWEQEKWSQYEPIRVDFVSLTEGQQRSLKSFAQVRVSLWRTPKQGVFGAISQLFSRVTG